MRKIEVLKDKNITWDLIEKCLQKVQMKHSSVRMQKFGKDKIVWYDGGSSGRKLGVLSKNQEGQLQFETDSYFEIKLEI